MLSRDVYDAPTQCESGTYSILLASSPVRRAPAPRGDERDRSQLECRAILCGFLLCNSGLDRGDPQRFRNRLRFALRRGGRLIAVDDINCDAFQKKKCDM